MKKLTDLQKFSQKKDLREAIPLLIEEPSRELPLAMRSTRKVVVLYGTPGDNKATSTAQDQSLLQDLVKTVFPNAEVEFYHAYHRLNVETLTLIASGYLSYEIIDLLRSYLKGVWPWKLEDEAKQDVILNSLLLGQDSMTLEALEEIIGHQEQFDYRFKDYPILSRTIQDRFGLKEEQMREHVLSVDHVWKAVQYTRDVSRFLSRPKKTRVKVPPPRL